MENLDIADPPSSLQWEYLLRAIQDPRSGLMEQKHKCARKLYMNHDPFKYKFRKNNCTKNGLLFWEVLVNYVSMTGTIIHS